MTIRGWRRPGRQVRSDRAAGAGLPALLLALSIAVLAGSMPVLAQVGSADLEGRVLGGAQGLEGADLLVRNQETGIVRPGASLANGSYRVPGLNTGIYEITVSHDGFAPVVRRDVRLAVGQVVRIDFALEPVVDYVETVAVTAEAPLIESTQSKPGVVIDEEEIRNLPLNSRNAVELALLAPGVSAFRSSSIPRFSPVNMAGQNNRGTRLVLDGLDLGSDFLGGVYGTTSVVSQNAVEQFEVSSSRFKAEYGNTSGGVINLTTRRGTNEFHGDAFAYFRDKSLNSRGRFESEKPPFVRQQFGASFGGPIVRDRTHFFVSFERNRQDDYVGVSNDGIFPNLEGNFRSPFRNTDVLARLDHQIDGSNWLTAEVLSEDHSRNEFFGGPVAANGGTHVEETVRGFSLLHRWAASDRLLNDLRFGYVRWRLDSVPFDSGPRFVYPSAEEGRWPGGVQKPREERWSLRDDLSYFVPDRAGSHTLKFGVAIDRIRDSVTSGSILDTGLFIVPVDDVNVPPIFALVGDGNSDLGSFVNYRIGLYAQDEWSPVRDLTLSLGLRYDYETNPTNGDYVSKKSAKGLPYVNRGGRGADADNIAPRIGFAWDTRGDGKTVLRGGFGVYFGRSYGTFAFGETFSDRYRVYFVPCPCPTDVSQISFTGLPYRVNWLLPEDVPTPYTNQFSLGFSRQLGQDLALDVDYVGARGYHEGFIPNDVNPPDPNTGLRPQPQFLEVYQARFDGRSIYDGLEVVVRKRLSRGHQWRVAYTLSEAENDADEPDFVSPGGFKRGHAAWDERHRLAVDGRVVLPAGFSISGLLTWTSARPYTIFTGNDENMNGDLTDDQPKGVDRNSKRADSYSSLDLRVSKVFDTGAGRLELIAEAFNLLDTTNYDPASYIGNLNSPNFGQPTATLPARQIQLGLRWSY